MRAPGQIQHGITGGENIVGDNHILVLYRISQILVGHNRVAPIDNDGIVPALIEQAHIQPKHGGEIDVAGAAPRRGR